MKTNLSVSSTIVTTIGLGLLASPVLADPGHIEDIGAGHTHFLALGAVGLALIIGGFALLHRIKRRNQNAQHLGK